MIRPNQRFLILDYETTGFDAQTQFPIEIGCVLTDSEFRTLETYETFIGWPGLGSEDGHWLPEHQGAYNVHKIEWRDYIQSAVRFGDVVHQVKTMCQKHFQGRKTILLSDNIQFEWGFTKKLFDEAGERWPFHHCGWDSSILLETTGVGDPIPDHRAMRDVALLQAALIRALDRVNR